MSLTQALNAARSGLAASQAGQTRRSIELTRCLARASK